MSEKDNLKKDIIKEFSNENGSIFKKYKNHKLFDFLKKEDWELVIKTLEEILENKYSQISSRAENFKDHRYWGDKQGEEIYIERIRRIQAQKQLNLTNLIERCKELEKK